MSKINGKTAMDLIRQNGANLISERFNSDGQHEITFGVDYSKDDLLDTMRYWHYSDWSTRVTAYNEMYKGPSKLTIKNVIFNDPATIVYWSDNTKTVVKTNKGDTFDKEKGLAMAISKKYLGNKGNYYNEFKKWIPEEPKETVKVEKEVKIYADNYPYYVKIVEDVVRKYNEKLEKSVNEEIIKKYNENLNKEGE